MNRDSRNPVKRGYTLAVVLVVMVAMLLMAVGVLAVVGIERRTARSYVDAKRAEWAARSGLEDFRGVLRTHTADDDFLVVAGARETPEDDVRQPLDYLFLARGMGGGDQVSHELHPLFSAANGAPEVADLRELPERELLTGDGTTRFTALPWAEDAEVAWVAVRDGEGRMVGRYAYWVEDLQSRVALDGGGEPWQAEDRVRGGWPHPAPGVPPRDEGPGIEMELHVLDPTSTGDVDESDLDERVVAGLPLMVSPGSAVAGAGFGAPLERGADGRLVDPSADALERALSPQVRPYLEQPLIPHAPGISAHFAGRPKLNLNRLLASPRALAVSEFAAWVGEGLPGFEARKGGFPDDYLKTLAAGALDYADEDSEATIGAGHRGLDGYPLISEVMLQVHFRGLELTAERKYLLWTIKVFAELWNMNDRPVSGEVSLSYENGLGTTGLGALPQGLRFDDPGLLLNPLRSTHDLNEADGRFWSRSVRFDLQADEYLTREFISVDYRIDVGPRSGPGSVFIQSFTLVEPPGSAGISLRWNDAEVDRIERIVRHSANPKSPDLIFNAEKAKFVTKAAVSGHSYGAPEDYVNNMGDPRISRYLRNPRWPLGLNAYPGNASPNRRNIRRGTIYDRDAGSKPKVFGRVLPSEWPDGGHNSAVGSWSTAGGDELPPTAPSLIGTPPDPDPASAPQRLSNAGRFYSATELGKVFDPVMWTPTYSDLDGRQGSGAADSRVLAGGLLPGRRDRWPRVAERALPSDMHGGGNTLCIGSDEHPKFDRPPQHAARLLDLFHAGIPRSDDPAEREGPVIGIDGRVNLNTAGKEVLRVIAAGLLKQDPGLSRVVKSDHRGAPYMAPVVGPLRLGTPTRDRAADLVAEAIIGSRPIRDAYELASIELRDRPGTDPPRGVFGNRELYSLGNGIEWNDAAAEELFGRIYEGTTVRSRNFRVWVVGQALVPREETSGVPPTVLAESRKVFCVFADPGERDAEGRINRKEYRPIVTYENDF